MAYWCADASVEVANCPGACHALERVVLSSPAPSEFQSNPPSAKAASNGASAASPGECSLPDEVSACSWRVTAGKVPRCSRKSWIYDVHWSGCRSTQERAHEQTERNHSAAITAASSSRGQNGAVWSHYCGQPRAVGFTLLQQLPSLSSHN